MYKNYLKIGLRSLLKQKIYSLINIIGLSVGIASCALILLNVENEFSYDNFHEKGDNLYKVSLERMYPGYSTFYDNIPHSYAEVMVADYPEIVNATRIGAPVRGNNTIMVHYNPESGEQLAFEESNVLLADSNFFQMFTLKLLKGEPDKVLEKANNMVITQETALKYFGQEDPINKTLNTDFGNYVITGVCENVPENSHFDFDFVGSLETFPFFQNINYMSFSTHTYIELDPLASPQELESKLPEMVKRYASSQIQQNLNMSYEEYVAAGNGYRYFLRHIQDIHLDPTNFQGKMNAGGSKTYVFILISVSIMILLIACINFMNLATARSTERAKEVGIRKTMGSERKQLIAQFLVESLLISFISMLVAFAIMYMALPYFNDLADKSLTIGIQDSFIVPGMLLFTLVAGLLAGSYPAFIISAYNPVSVMKGKFHSSSKGSWLRNGLVIFQFWISIMLIVGTLVISKQMRFMQNKPLGFDKEQMITIPRAFVLITPGNPQANPPVQGVNRIESFKEQLLNIAGVVNTASSNVVPGAGQFGIQFTPEGANEPFTANGMIADDDYIKSIGFEILEGRGFSEDFDDSLSIIINERAVKSMGLAEPVGTRLNNTSGNPQVIRTYTIIGVVKDFHYQSLRNEITPFILMSNEGFGGGGGVISVRISSENINQTISNIEAKWKEFVPEQPFKFHFLDQSLDDQYQAEKNSISVFIVFAGLAIIIACVGLFGLSAYTAGLRTKEIGIRKVMGASVLEVVFMLSKDFTKLILIAFVLAIPVAYYGMDQWLQGFYYRTGIDVFTFIIAGLSALLISWLTVSYQSIKASIANPVKSLQSE